MSTTITNPTVIDVELPVPLDPRWNRIPGIEVDGRSVSLDPSEYFFRFESSSWLICDWQLVKDELLSVRESTDQALEQAVLDFINENGRSTSNAGDVLRIAWEVYSYVFRDELLPVEGLPEIGPQHLRMLREAATFMALNKVELDGTIANIGPCWFFPAATSVVFDLDDTEGQMLDEVYHSTWFNEYRRIESVKAHAALGGRLVHGCQSVPSSSGGVCVPYGASIDTFRAELSRFRDSWLDQVLANRVPQD